MIDQATLQKLCEMRLTNMADSYREQLKNPQFQDMMFEKRFGILVDIEWSKWKSNHLAKLIKGASFQQSYAVIDPVCLSVSMAYITFSCVYIWAPSLGVQLYVRTTPTKLDDLLLNFTTNKR